MTKSEFLNRLYEIRSKCENKNILQHITKMIRHIEQELGKKVEFDFLDMQPGDVKATFANIEHAKNKLNYNPKISINEGIPKFIKWYKSYYNLH